MVRKAFEMRSYLAISGLLLALATPILPVFAKAGAQQKATKSEDDPTREICRQVRETGSRLVSHRVCMTKAQWDEQRRQDRMMVERSQMSSCVPGAGC